MRVALAVLLSLVSWRASAGGVTNVAAGSDACIFVPSTMSRPACTPADYDKRPVDQRPVIMYTRPEGEAGQRIVVKYPHRDTEGKLVYAEKGAVPSSSEAAAVPAARPSEPLTKPGKVCKSRGEHGEIKFERCAG